MYRYLIIVVLMNSFTHLTAQSMKTAFEIDNNTTSTYDEAIAFYEKLAEQYPEFVSIAKHGNIDAGYPFQTVVIEKGNLQKSEDLVTIFINNAIHPGEPCGVDASMMLFRDILSSEELMTILNKMRFVIVPVYNITGSLNRGSHSRANQLGPVSYGFRGSDNNLDLNRDFIKCDSKNALIFNQVFSHWNPNIFIDNHTSNGADYQYSMTLIPTQKDKLQEDLSDYLYDKMLPDLFSKMENAGWEMTPYVYARNTPDNGIAAFLDLPRYSSGYAALHNCISFMPETHMLKPYRNRVLSTYHFMRSMIDHTLINHEALLSIKAKAQESVKKQKKFDVSWRLDMSRKEKIIFKGYEAKYKASEIHGNDRLYYDHDAPYTKEIDHLLYYNAELSINIPKAYVVPQHWVKVNERLKSNGIFGKPLQQDTVMEVNFYYIEDYETVKRPYEGHYLHSDVKVREELQTTKFRKGDIIYETNQKGNSYLVHVLEPQSADSFFAWNFFDAILQQKEYFSSYVFEDLAIELLQNNPQLKKALEEKKLEDPEWAKSGYNQLKFIYENSPHYEKTHNRYPVGRIMK